MPAFTWTDDHTVEQVARGRAVGMARQTVTAPALTNAPAQAVLDAAMAEMLAVGVLSATFNVRAPQFGAVGDGVTDDTAAIQAAITAAASATLFRAKATGDVGADSYAPPVVIVPSGTYKISSAIVVNNHIRFFADNEVFVKQVTATADVFNSGSGAGYLTHIKGFHLIGGRQQIVLSRVNADTSMNIIENCTFSSADPTRFAVDVTLRSGHLLIKHCRVLDAPQFLKTTDCDVVVLENNLVNGYAQTTNQKPANTASYSFNSSVGTSNRVTFRDCIHIPEPELGAATLANTRWIDFTDYVSIDSFGTQWGGENAGFPVAYCNASAGVPAVYPNGQVGGIQFFGGSVFAGANTRADRGVVVLRKGMPSRIAMYGVTGPYDGYLVNDTQMVLSDGVTPTTAAAYLASLIAISANHPRLSVVDFGNTMPGSSTLSSTTFSPFVTALSHVVGGPNTLTAGRFVGVVTETQITPTEAVLVSGVNAATGNSAKVTLTAARVVGAPLNPSTGQRLAFTFVQNATGGWAVTWNAVFKVSWSDTGNTLNKRSSIAFIWDGVNWNQDGAQTPYV